MIGGYSAFIAYYTTRREVFLRSNVAGKWKMPNTANDQTLA